MKKNVEILLSNMSAHQILEKMMQGDVVHGTRIHADFRTALMIKMYKTEDYSCLVELIENAKTPLDYKVADYICSESRGKYIIQKFDCVKKLIEVEDVYSRYEGVLLHAALAGEFEDIEKLILCVYDDEPLIRYKVLEIFAKFNDETLDLILSHSNKNKVFDYFKLLKTSVLKSLTKEFFLQNIKKNDSVYKRILFISAVKKKLDIELLKELVHLSNDVDLFDYFYSNMLFREPFKSQFEKTFGKDLVDFC